MVPKIKRLLSDPRDFIASKIAGVWVNGLRKWHAEARGTIDALARLARTQHSLERPLLEHVFEDSVNDQDTDDLGRLFKHHGSDKSTKHNYYLMYGSLLKGRRGEPLKILEIGLGTNDVTLPSNMGVSGRPGASLRAFRDWGPQISVVGADIDTKILFSDERIATHFVDQMDPEALMELAGKFEKESFDLIIDDGLHEPVANINSLIFALDLLRPGGHVVIEDILDKYLTDWEAVIAIMSPQYTCTLVRERAEFACVFQKSR